MLRRILKVAACAGSLALSGSALADHHGDHKGHMHNGNEGHHMHKKTMGKTAGMPFKIGAELRTEWNYSDNGIQEAVVNEAESTSSLGLNSLKLKIKGHLTSTTSFNFLLNNTPFITGTTPNSDFVELGYVTHRINDMLSLRVGRDYTNFGGFERKEQEFDAFSNSLYITDSDPLGLNSDGAALLFNWEGSAVNVQVVQPRGALGVSTRQPSVTAEYHGKFGAIHALAQVASYKLDNEGSSMAYGVGVKYSMHGLMAHIDYGMNQLDDKYDASRIGVHVKYDMGDFIPFVKYTMFDVDQEGTDADDNTGSGNALVLGDLTGSRGEIAANDNLNQWTVGSHWRMNGDVFRPYLAVVGTSGDYAAGAGLDDSPSQIDIKVGVMSEF